MSLEEPSKCPNCDEVLNYEPFPENDGFCSKDCLEEWYRI